MSGEQVGVTGRRDRAGPPRAARCFLAHTKHSEKVACPIFLSRSTPVLPALEDEFEGVAVRICDLRRIVSGIVVKLRTRRMYLATACSDGGGVRGINHRLRVGDEPDVNRPRRRLARPEPEEHAPLCPEALEVWMAGRAVLPVVIQALRDAERLEGGTVEGDRKFEVADRQEDVIEHDTLLR